MKKYYSIVVLLFIFILSISKISSIPIKLSEIDISYDDIAINNNILYAVSDGIDVYDISNPNNPVEISNLNFEYGNLYPESTNITLNSNKIYIINKLYNYENNEYNIYAAKLVIIDISDPNNLVLLGDQNISTSSKSIEIENGFAYIVYDNGFEIYDISNPTLIELISTTGINNAQSITVKNNIGYICCKHDGIKFFDLNNPIEPVLISGFNTNGTAYFSFIENNNAYICDGENGIVILDVANLESPILISTYDAPGKSIHCDVQNSKLFIVDENYGMQIVDIINPYSPSFISAFEPFYFSKNCISMDEIVILTGSNINVIDIGDLSNPDYEVHFDLQNEKYAELKFYDQIAHVYLSDRYDPSYFDRIQMIDFYDIYNPQVLGHYTPFSNMIGYDVSNNYSYSVRSHLGLNICDISDPLVPELISTIGSNPVYTGLAINDDTAYVPNWHSIDVVNISNPANPSIVNNIVIDSYQNDDAYTFNNNLFVTNVYGQITVFDITNQHNPTLLTTLDLDGTIEEIKFRSNYMFVSQYSMLKIVDISDPSLPVICNIMPIPYYKFEIIDNQLFVIDSHWNRVHIYDISDNSNPIAEGYINYNYQVIEIKKFQNLFAIMTENNGFYFYNELWEIVDINGDTIPHSTSNFINLSNYPNPFNPSTTIEFSIQQDSKIELCIYNIRGQKIKTLAQDRYSKGSHSIIWNGDDSLGNTVSSGVYLYKIIDINKKSEIVNKCLLLK